MAMPAGAGTGYRSEGPAGHMSKSADSRPGLGYNRPAGMGAVA
jgi:hypothetical protein